jgi:hypothetical protein
VADVTAGRMFGFDGCDRVNDVYLAVHGSAHRTSLPGVIIHRSTLLTPKMFVVVDGIRVVPKPVALVQIAGSHGTDAAAKALDSVLRDGASPVWLERVFREWARPGVKGGSEILELLLDRAGRRLPRSWFQRLARRVLAARAIALVDEHPVFDPNTGKLLAELDLANPELMIGVECQSWEWHGSPAAQARDGRRKRRLRLLGWEIVDCWYSDLRRVDEIAEEVLYLIDRRIPRLLA